MTGKEKNAIGQQAFLAGHCPLTGRYIAPLRHLLTIT